MTLPDERYRALVYTERFLMDLCDPSATPKVPRTVRQRAAQCLRHYPSTYHLEQLAACVPSVVDTDMEDTKRFVLRGVATWDLNVPPVDKVKD